MNDKTIDIKRSCKTLRLEAEKHLNEGDNRIAPSYKTWGCSGKNHNPILVPNFLHSGKNYGSLNPLGGFPKPIRRVP